MQPASSITFIPVQLYSTFDYRKTDKNKQVTIAKPMQTALTAINKLFAL
jgi:hypothetical protein